MNPGSAIMLSARMISAPGADRLAATAMITPSRTWISPPRISPIFGSMVRTCAFLTISSPRSGSFPSDRPAARGEVVAARVAQPDSAIVPSAVAAPRNPRRLILIFIRPTPNPQRCGPLCCYIKDRHSSKLTNDKRSRGLLETSDAEVFWHVLSLRFDGKFLSPLSKHPTELDPRRLFFPSLWGFVDQGP